MEHVSHVTHNAWGLGKHHWLGQSQQRSPIILCECMGPSHPFLQVRTREASFNNAAEVAGGATQGFWF